MLAPPSGQHPGNQAPKGPGVVLLDSVTKLMNDDVVLHAASELHHPGMKQQDVLGIAARPSALKMSDTGPYCFQAGFTFPMSDPGQQFFFRACSVKAFQQRKHDFGRDSAPPRTLHHEA